jgi:hypothetical protein
MGRVEKRTWCETRRRTRKQRLRWCTSAAWAMERQFGRVKYYRQLPLLQLAVQRTLSPTTTAATYAAPRATSPEYQLRRGQTPRA